MNHKIEAKLKDGIFLSAAVCLLSGSSGSQINTQLLYTGDGAQWISEGNSAWDKELKQPMKVQSPFTESIVYHRHAWLKRLSDFSWFHTSLPYFLRLVWAIEHTQKTQNNNGHCIPPLHLGVWGARIPTLFWKWLIWEWSTILKYWGWKDVLKGRVWAWRREGGGYTIYPRYCGYFVVILFCESALTR